MKHVEKKSVEQKNGASGALCGVRCDQIHKRQENSTAMVEDIMTKADIDPLNASLVGVGGGEDVVGVEVGVVDTGALGDEGGILGVATVGGGEEVGAEEGTGGGDKGAGEVGGGGADVGVEVGGGEDVGVEVGAGEDVGVDVGVGVIGVAVGVVGAEGAGAQGKR